MRIFLLSYFFYPLIWEVNALASSFCAYFEPLLLYFLLFLSLSAFCYFMYLAFSSLIYLWSMWLPMNLAIFLMQLEWSLNFSTASKKFLWSASDHFLSYLGVIWLLFNWSTTDCEALISLDESFPLYPASSWYFLSFSSSIWLTHCL